MITIVKADGTAEQQQIAAMRERAAKTGAGIEQSAREIMEAVRRRGYEAVKEYSLKFDGAEPYEIPKSELQAAAERIAPKLLGALRRSAENIRAYQTELLCKSRRWESPVKGGTVGQVVRGLSRVGIYVPGGTGGLSQLGTDECGSGQGSGRASEVIMVTPPTENLNDAVLAAAWVAQSGSGHCGWRRSGGGGADLWGRIHPQSGQAGGPRQCLCGGGEAHGLWHAGHRHGGWAL